MTQDREFSWRWAIAAAVVYMALAVVVTWPLFRGMRTQIPADLGDPLLNVWTLWWGLSRITSLDFSGYFDANIMYPHPGSLAMSEHLTTLSVLGLPFWLVSKNPVFVYNALYVLSFAAAGVGAFVLAKRLSGSVFGAFAAGLVFAFAPYRFAQDGHIQVLWSAFIPLSFYALINLCAKARVRDAVLLALFFVLQSGANMYFGLFLAVACVVVFAGFGAANGGIGRPRVWLLVFCAGAVAAVVLLPFTLPYLDVRERFGFVRQIETISSLEPRNFLGVRHFNRLWGETLARFDRPEGGLFPGAAALVLAFVGLFHRRAEPGTRPAFAVLLVAGCLISMGPRPRIEFFGTSHEGGHLYRFLYDWLPGFSGTRVPFRFHVMSMLALSVLSACGVAAVLTVLKRHASYPLVGALVLALPFEYYSVIPLSQFQRGAKPSALYERLRSLPDGPVIEFPQDAYGHVFNASVHGKKAYTPFSGMHSPLERAVNRMQSDPGWDLTIPLLESMGIRYVVVKKAHPLHAALRAAGRSGEASVEPVHDDSEGTIFEIRGRGPHFLDPSRDFYDLSAQVKMKYDLALAIRLNADNDRPVMSRTSYLPGLLRLRAGGRDVHRADVKFGLPPHSTGTELAATRAQVPFGTVFDEVCIEFGEAEFCAAPTRL
ncbi:MAG: hypothetical protein HY897_06710 [Deltaproteobacteria bacterium]|nr:hypothetical protein [Deltaproteobacteria bacterium]